MDSTPDLVIAHNFPPYADASSITMAKRVVVWGKPVDVVSQRMENQRTRDESLEALVRELVTKKYELSGPVGFSAWNSIGAFVARGLVAVGSSRGKYKQIYSRSMWVHSHFLAAALKLRWPEVQWTAEFSDPVTRAADGSVRPSGVVVPDRLARWYFAHASPDLRAAIQSSTSVLSWGELLPYGVADRLVFTNVQQQRAMTSDIRSQELKARVTQISQTVSHPTLPKRFYGESSAAANRAGAAARFAYFGSFYANRGLHEFLEALRIVLRRRGRIATLDVFTDSGSTFGQVVSEYGLQDSVLCRPTLPFRLALQEFSSFDVLVVNDVTAGNFGVPSPFLPSKLSDYQGSGVPVFSLSRPGTPLDRAQTSFRARMGDLGDIVREIERACDAGSLREQTEVS